MVRRPALVHGQGQAQPVSCRAAREENTPPSVCERVGYIVGSQRNSLARPTQTQRDAYAMASQEFRSALGRLRTLIDTDLRRLQEALHEAGAPWTPGLLPDWKER